MCNKLTELIWFGVQLDWNKLEKKLKYRHFFCIFEYFIRGYVLTKTACDE